MTEVSITVGKKIREFRRNRCLSITEVADYLGVSQPQMSRYERGVTPVCADKLYKLSVLLECGVDDFFSDVTDGGCPDSYLSADTAAMIEDYFSHKCIAS